jgi:hypothetical protein
MSTVVHVKSGDYDVYIGRAVPRMKLKASPWANPFKITRECNRMDAIAHFRFWVRFSNEPRAVWIREHVHELKGKRLGCWCRPYHCHGDVLAALAEATP